MRLVQYAALNRHAITQDVLPVVAHRAGYWGEPEGQIAPATWLGAFTLSEPYRCAARCGKMAIARASWIYRGKILALELCLECCRTARDHKHPCLSVLPPRLATEQRPTRPTDPSKPRINGWKRNP